MYNLNGIPLDNPAFGWSLLESSAPVLSHSVERERLRIPGRDGVVPLPGTASATVMRLTVETPRANLDDLLALAAADPVITPTAAPAPGEPAKSVAAEFLASSPTGYGPADEILEVDLIFNLPGAFWRAATESTSGFVTLSSASVAVGVLTGISAPVQDAIVRVRGAVGGLRVTDEASGAYFAYAGTLTTTQYLRFESATGRAYMTTSDTWAGGTEVSGDIDYDGPRGVFEVTPKLNATDPSSRGGSIVVTTTSRTTAAVQIRGRGAYRAL